MYIIKFIYISEQVCMFSYEDTILITAASGMMSFGRLLKVPNGRVYGSICLRQRSMYRGVTAVFSQHVIPATCIQGFRNSQIATRRTYKNTYHKFDKYDEQQVSTFGKFYYFLLFSLLVSLMFVPQ